MSEWSGSVVYDYDKKTSTMNLGSYKSGSSADGDSALYVVQPMNTKCVELWVMSDPGYTNGQDFRGIFGFNSLSGGADGNVDRVIMTVGVASSSSDNTRMYISGLVVPDLESKDYFDTPRHVVFQYESATNETVLYLDGVVKYRYPGDAYDLLIEGRYFTPGLFHYYNNPIYNLHGRTYCSDCALYDRPLTMDEINARINSDEYEISLRSLHSQPKPTWAHQLTRAQANPQSNELLVLEQKPEQKIIGKLGNYNSLIKQNGEQRKVGYYQSTVTVSDVPKPNTRVLCFTNGGQLLDETYSNESGVYRFDHLLMDNKYLFVAQYNNGNKQVAPEYLAAAADWQTPTPYGS
ncbi:hypothetical protein ACR30L_11915 [Psychromonas sp. PT13]|uniref:hypothetical protein n=1 Tax=Psychromonas sp. PT13 TaxID=3439547 RepID=UPI003EC051B3